MCGVLFVLCDVLCVLWDMLCVLWDVLCVVCCVHCAVWVRVYFQLSSFCRCRLTRHQAYSSPPFEITAAAYIVLVSMLTRGSSVGVVYSYKLGDRD